MKSLMLSAIREEVLLYSSIEVNGESLGKIPIIRYRFGSYGEKEIEYILKCKDKHTKSVHLIEIDIESMDREKFNEIIPRMHGENIAVYLRMKIDDEMLKDGDLSKLTGVDVTRVDRLVIVDETTTMNYSSLRDFKRIIVLRHEGMDVRNIGTCGVLSNIDGNACVTAEQDKKLASLYTEGEGLPVPSKKHEDGCGCIRYVRVFEDTEITPGKGKGKSKKIVAKSSIIKGKKKKGLPKWV